VSDDPVVPPRRRPSVLLIVSLCLNLALIGLAAMMFMRGFETHDPKAGLSAQALMRMVPGEKDKIAGIIDAHHAHLHELRQQTMQARAELFGLLSAPDFDKAAFAKSIATVQSADAALEAENLKTTADAVAVLTPKERESVAGQVHKPGRSWLRRMFRKR
jgi:Spy/CpxP family protein refolding chaperone